MSNRKGKGSTVNRTELAGLFGVSLPTIDTWQREGCPVAKKGGRGKSFEYNTAAVAEWREERARNEGAGNVKATEHELKMRKLAAETALVELDLAKAQDVVAPIEQFERALANIFAEVKTSLRNVPTRAVGQILGETDERIVKKKLLAEIDLALENLANGELVDPDVLEFENEEEE